MKYFSKLFFTAFLFVSLTGNIFACAFDDKSSHPFGPVGHGSFRPHVNGLADEEISGLIQTTRGSGCLELNAACDLLEGTDRAFRADRDTLRKIIVGGAYKAVSAPIIIASIEECNRVFLDVIKAIDKLPIAQNWVFKGGLFRLTGNLGGKRDHEGKPVIVRNWYLEDALRLLTEHPAIASGDLSTLPILYDSECCSLMIALYFSAFLVDESALKLAANDLLTFHPASIPEAANKMLSDCPLRVGEDFVMPTSRYVYGGNRNLETAVGDVLISDCSGLISRIAAMILPEGPLKSFFSQNRTATFYLHLAYLGLMGEKRSPEEETRYNESGARDPNVQNLMRILRIVDIDKVFPGTLLLYKTHVVMAAGSEYGDGEVPAIEWNRQDKGPTDGTRDGGGFVRLSKKRDGGVRAMRFFID